MAEVTIRYFGVLREITGKRAEQVRIEDDSTLLELIQNLAKRHGPKFKNFVYAENEHLNKSLAFAANGDAMPVSRLKVLKCGEIEEFVILPPISGGL